METRLGYTISSLNYPHDASNRLYSDLTIVPESAYERAQKEIEQLESGDRHDFQSLLGEKFPALDVPQTIMWRGDMVTFRRRSHVGFYVFTGDVHYKFGLDVHFLLTNAEVFESMMSYKCTPPSTIDPGPILARLPPEILERILSLSMPKGRWNAADVEDTKSDLLPLGNLSGFHFPLSSLPILKVSKSIHSRALPLVYRATEFQLEDMDTVIRLLMAIGSIERDNIESLEFSWQSRSDFQLWPPGSSKPPIAHGNYQSSM
ncbi:hypothetical protein PV08_07123 [Exophiala spinifera]|uniref:F-box domain-containing protein n=1 Tax=Exophiala spinifera TaxID=91928 RepID=A0A0D1YHB9_9EURO|nr:uncharacterized protein PV08_07123 [Exophiala spinifera]KIW14341.1 hypothetical protein PV08_07123 [Exophiala spinifera]